jgi:hypothetical protein
MPDPLAGVQVQLLQAVALGAPTGPLDGVSAARFT